MHIVSEGDNTELHVSDGIHCSNPVHLEARRASAIYKISIPKNSSYVNIVIDVLFAGHVLTCAGMGPIYH